MGLKNARARKRGKNGLLWVVADPEEGDDEATSTNARVVEHAVGDSEPERDNGRWLRAGVAVAVTVLAALTYTFVSLLRSGALNIQQSDLLVYYAAAKLVLDGHGDAIYSLSALRHVEVSYLPASMLPRTQAAFLYPPFVALLFAPLAALGFVQAYVSWIAVNVALAGGAIEALRRYTDLSALTGVLFGLLSLSFFPLFATLIQGQAAILLLAALTAALLALLGGRDDVAGVALAFTLIKPPYCIPFLVLLLVQRRWRALISFGLVSAALATLPLFVLGPSVDSGYVHLLLQATQWHTTAGGFSPTANHNLSGFTHLLLPQGIALGAQVVLSALCLLAVASCAWKWRAVEIPFAVAVVAALLVNPHVLIHDLAMLLIPAAVALRHRQVMPRVLAAVLAFAYVSALAGLRLLALVPVQVTVLAMVALGVWLILAGGSVAPAPFGYSWARRSAEEQHLHALPPGK